MIYNISDTLNNLVDTARLYNEIASSSITIALDSVSSSITQIDIQFKANLSPAEIETLTSLVSSHDGSPLEVVSVQKTEQLADISGGGLAKVDIGHRFSGAAGNVIVSDFQVNRDCYVKGGLLCVEGNDIMDQITLTVVDYNYIYAGILYDAEYAEGVPWSVALPTGVPLHTYLQSYPIPKDGHLEIDHYRHSDLNMNGVAIRIEYDSQGSSGDVKVNMGIKGVE